MNDVNKTIVAVLLTAVLSPVITISKLGADIENLDKAVTKIDKKLERFDERVRQVEIQQATLLAAN